MQIRTEGLAQHFAKGLRAIYTVYGDEPLLAQEAGDLIRAAARAQGYGERKVFTVAGNHFDWAQVQGAAQALSRQGAAVGQMLSRRAGRGAHRRRRGWRPC